MKLNPCKNVPAAQMGPAVTRQLLAYCEGENGYTVKLLTGKKALPPRRTAIRTCRLST